MTRSELHLDRFPPEFHADIRRAVEILKEGGCAEVHVFGSVAEDRVLEGSDLDLAVRGCPPDRSIQYQEMFRNRTDDHD